MFIWNEVDFPDSKKEWKNKGFYEFDGFPGSSAL